MKKSVKVEYTPLIAKVALNRNNPSRFVAFVDGQICFFDKEVDTSVLTVDQEIEVMVTRAVYGRYPEGHSKAGLTDFGFLRGLSISPVDQTKHTRVNVTGFSFNPETKISLGTGTATGYTKEYTVNAGRTSAQSSRPGNDTVTPLTVWVNKDDLDNQELDEITAVGLTGIRDGRWVHLMRKR